MAGKANHLLVAVEEPPQRAALLLLAGVVHRVLGVVVRDGEDRLGGIPRDGGGKGVAELGDFAFGVALRAGEMERDELVALHAGPHDTRVRRVAKDGVEVAADGAGGARGAEFRADEAQFVVSDAGDVR